MKKVIKKDQVLDSKVDSLIETVNSLAISVSKGFENTAKDLDLVKRELRADIESVTERLDNIDFRLSRIENDNSRRLENLEDKVRIFATIFEKNLKIKFTK